MMNEAEQTSETVSVRRHVTCPELIDHDYWINEGKDSVTEEEVNNVADHCNSEDPGFYRFFICHHCGNTWNNLPELMLHLESAHPSEPELDSESHTIYNLGLSQAHSCLYCDFATEVFDLLIDHIKSCHQIVRDHCCPHCEYRSLMRASLKDHLSRKHRDSCIYCILNFH